MNGTQESESGTSREMRCPAPWALHLVQVGNLRTGIPSRVVSCNDGVGATAGIESLALTVAMAVKRLHLCLLCVATAFPAAAGGPLLAGI